MPAYPQGMPVPSAPSPPLPCPAQAAPVPLVNPVMKPLSVPRAPRVSRWKALQLRGHTLGRLSLQGKLMLAFSMLLLTALAAATGAFLTRGTSAVDGLMGEQARQLSQTLAYAALAS